MATYNSALEQGHRPVYERTNSLGSHKCLPVILSAFRCADIVAPQP